MTKFYKKIIIFSLIYFFIFLGFSRSSSTIPSILFILFSFIIAKIERRDFSITFSKNPFLILTTTFFIITLFGFFKEDIFNDFIKKEKLKIFFFLIPFTFYLLKDYVLKYSNLLIKTSLIGNFSAIIFFLFVATFKFPKFGLNSFLYGELVSISSLSIIVYTFYLNVNVILLFYSDIIKNNIIKHLLILFQGFFIFLTISKIGILIFIISYIIFIFIEIKRNVKFGFSILLLSVLFSSVMISFGLKTDNIQRRINNFKSNLIHLERNEIEESFPRVVIIKYSKNILKDHLFFGVGVSNVRESLKSEFLKINYKKGLDYNLDAHNQYIQTILGMGIVGLVSLLSMFFYLYYIAIKRRDWLLLHFVFIISLASLSESLFESQMGVFIFLLYSLLFLIKHENKKIKC